MAFVSTVKPAASSLVRPGAEGGLTLSEAEFETLYRKTARPLRNYIARVAGDSSVADDILQKTYYNLLRTKLTSDEERQVKSLLYRIATNLVIDQWRTARRERESLLRGWLTRTVATGTENDHDVRKIFHLLAPRERALVWLAYVEELSHQEIGAILGVATESVRVLLHRAKRRFASLLDRHGYSAGEAP